jgi:hypothetical protein
MFAAPFPLAETPERLSRSPETPGSLPATGTGLFSRAGALPVTRSTASFCRSPRCRPMVRTTFIFDSPKSRDSSVAGYSTTRPPFRLSSIKVSATPRKPLFSGSKFSNARLRYTRQQLVYV